MANGTIQNMQVRFLGGYGQEDILEHAKNMANNTMEFWVNSNSPTNCPAGCSWGSYVFLCSSYNDIKFTSILYFDKKHIASTYAINNTTTEIEWHIV